MLSPSKMHIWLIELSLDLLFYNAKLHVHKGEGNKFLDGNLHRLSNKDNLDVVMNERLTPLLMQQGELLSMLVGWFIIFFTQIPGLRGRISYFGTFMGWFIVFMSLI